MGEHPTSTLGYRSLPALETLKGLAGDEIQVIFIPLRRNPIVPFHSSSVGLRSRNPALPFFVTEPTGLTFSGAMDTTPLQLEEKGYFLGYQKKVSTHFYVSTDLVSGKPIF